MAESRRLSRASSFKYNPSKSLDSQQLFKTNKPIAIMASAEGIAASASNTIQGQLLNGFGKVVSLNNLSRFSTESIDNSAEQSAVLGWDLLTSRTVINTSKVQSVERNDELSNAWQITLSTQVNPYQAVAVTKQLTVDVYAVRLSEYDLKQRDLFTSINSIIELDGEAYIPSPVFEWGNYQLTKLPAAPMASSIRGKAYQPPAKSDLTKLPWGEGVSLHYSPELPYIVEPEIIVPGEVPDPNKQEVYIIMNSVNVISLPDGEALAVADIKIDLDEDSYSWKFSASVLNQQSVDLMKPNAGGYKEIEVSINGYTWVFFITTWQRSKSIDGNKLDKKFQVSGYSRTQYLGLPHAPKRTKSIGTTTAVQAAVSELVGTGFTLDWNVSLLPDWVMQNSVFSYQELTPLQVIKRLATTVGAVVLPSMASDKITVIPRDRIVPWELESADMDRTIHENQILSEGGSLQTEHKINAVRVSGESQGVDMNVTRLGTAGDQPGSDIVDSWLSAAEANTSRGRAEIAASGNAEINTLELTIPETSSQPGLLLPGLYVSVQHNNDALDYSAKVTAVSISSPGRGLVKVRQTVTLKRSIAWESVA